VNDKLKMPNNYH